jgi:uncharacterized membrane protein YsdA (DUF1294 family)
MNLAWMLLLLWVSVSGLSGFILMGIDKARAVERAWRIPEASFFTLAFLGGTFGILLGSGVFHHKTLKTSFMSLIILSAVLWLGILFEIQRMIGPPFG